MSPLRIADVSLPAYFIPIAVTNDWSVPLNAGIDISAATVFPIIGEPMCIIYDLFFEFWDGYGGIVDYASLKFDAGLNSFSYKDLLGNATPWVAPPNAGDVVVLLMTRVKK